MRNNELFEQHNIVLTPLSPIHIGCGEELEPTNFVADPSERLLYFFEPSLIPLTPGQREELGRIAKSSPVTSIFEFYKSHLDLYSAFASSVIPYDKQSSRKIEKLLSGGPDRDFKISRAIYTVCRAHVSPYVPGSTVKGSIHTAYLDRVASTSPYSKLQNNELDEKLLGGKMEKSPMKLISISDFMQTSEDVSRTRIVAARRISVKAPPLLSGEGIPVYVEAIVPGQYRSFKSEIVLKKPNQKDVVNKEVAYKSVEQIIKDLHRFNFEQFNEQFSYWEKADPHSRSWLYSVEKLLTALKPKFERGEAALIRLGKHTGAQNFTIRKSGFPQIKSKNGRGKKPDFVETPRTINCAVFDNSGFQGLLPFGWILLELDPQKEELISNWCRNLNKNIPLNTRLFDEETKRRQADLLKKRQQICQQEEEARQMSELTENLRRLMRIVKKIEGTSKVSPGSELSKEIITLLDDAQSWAREEQLKVANAMSPYLKTKGLDAGKVGKSIKSSLRTLRGQ